MISHNILFNAENGRGIKLGPGGTDGGAVNVDGPLQHDLQQLAEREPVARHHRGRASSATSWSKARESNITAFKLHGSGNVARENIGDAAPAFLVRTGTPGSLLDGGGNLRSRHLRFDSIGCAGFHPGRFGPTEPGVMDSRRLAWGI